MNKEMVDLLLIEGKKGNKEAMEKLFEIHKGLIYKYSTKYFIIRGIGFMNKEMVDLLLIEGKKGNKEAMEKLFEIHKGLIYKYSTKYFIKGYDREDLEQIGWIEFMNGVKKYDGSFGIDFVAFITILLRNKYGCMLKRKEIDMKFSSLDTPIGEDITMKDTLEDIDFVAFITILLRNKYGCMLKRKEIDMKFSSLDTPIGEDITMKDTLEDDFSMENDFEHREEMEALLNSISILEDEEREFILYINEERGNMQKYYEEHKNEMTFNAVRYKKKKIMDKIQKALKKKGIKVK